MSFSGKNVLVTGASRGIGRVIAREFAEQGANIAIHYNQNLQAAEQTLASLKNGQHFIVQAEIGDANSAQELVNTTVHKMGKIDILVNNAGVYKLHPIAECGFEQWQEVWQQTLFTNLFGPANISFCAIQHMLKQGGGRIINISSRGAFRGEPDAPAYGASKAGLNAMSQSMAKALAPHNIFVYVVAPGYVETDMAKSILNGPSGDEIRNQSPLGRVAHPEEIARTVLFLASEGLDYLTGCIVDVNGASYLRS